MAGRQRPAPQLQALAQERLGLGGPALVDEAEAEDLQDPRHHRVGVRQDPPAQRECLAAEGLGFAGRSPGAEEVRERVDGADGVGVLRAQEAPDASPSDSR